ncbi:hypothetical protein [Corynebacterium sp. HMSC076G08]|uniref:hypothetical protein n=1 Tax=Corynebacterium sp. HMSC076G08 TaxID=1739310 RepID=UPI00130107D5|nr:hypothetical protein [Corynebacterium sp. HMSC076G08]
MLPLTQKYSNNPNNQIAPQRAFLTITTALRMTDSAVLPAVDSAISENLPRKKNRKLDI